jgi:N-methylhydantoinase B/oxoprolinase/acetone carboxylase alpha subunit
MARINLSIPDDMKVRMDQSLEENWSAVAKEAFAHRLEINKLKGSDMQAQAAGIERLRASKQKNTEREHAEGVNLGKKWAIEYAEYDQLRRVANLRERYRTDGEMDSSLLTLAINDYDQLSSGDIAEMMDEVLDTQKPSDSMVVGFVEGAGEVFDCV